MFSSIQSIPGLIFARSDVKAKIRPGVEANNYVVCCRPTHPSYLLITLTTCVLRYGSLEFELPSNTYRLQTRVH